MKEVDILVKLDHDNIIKLFEYFDEPDKLHLILELCHGGSLQEDVSKNGVYSEHQAARVMHQLLDGVAYIHSQNISHRDIKVSIALSTFPSNI
jgi:calcium-dependent protein kinase